ncbi:NAD-dependent epimerase/dehydratase family protein [Rhodococcoides fascians]|uniref:NAD-dependent epimerase/dehydratase family protein n=1 Tax=Rhodococcoides fascians TaxID=1828 RepID=UPI0024B93FA7|nr:NAD-dependent epimerase/dehydratase family protein [Rhodococcus fascians]MDJ0412682.1 NAD-dependent epimerase/dehydratase family protein [Rhodococcus fascians]
MKCLVTGATGFVGSNLVRDLVHAGHEVLASGAPGSTTRFLSGLPVKIQLADLLDRHAVDSLVKGQDWVFHLAGDTSTWRKLSARRRSVNVVAAGIVANASVDAGVGRLVHTSTIDVHGCNSDGSPVDERGGSNPLTGMGYDYAETKVAGEQQVRNRIVDGLDVVVVYPGFMIGPFDHTLQLGRVIRDMQEGKTTFAFSGTSSFCDVRGVSAGILAAAEHGRCGEGYNLSGYNVGYTEMFARIAELVGAKRRPVRLPRGALVAYGAVQEVSAMVTGRPPSMDRGLGRYLSSPQSSDWGKAQRELGYSPGNIDIAIIDAAQWYDDNVCT